MENSCVICSRPIDAIHYAIRDMKPHETYGEWLWRHIVRVLTFGLKSRKYATILPVCDGCTEMRLASNIAGASPYVA